MLMKGSLGRNLRLLPQMKLNPPFYHAVRQISSRSDFIHKYGFIPTKADLVEKTSPCSDEVFSGGDNKTRTCDPLHVKQVL